MKLQMLTASAVPVLGVARVKVLEAKAGTTQRSRGSAWMKMRQRVLVAADWTCASCGRVHGSNQVDHVVPLEQGGADGESNLQVLCVECHKRKTADETRRRYGVA